MNHFTNSAWECLLGFLQPCDESVTDDEVAADLKRFGIDMTSANQRLHRMLAEQRARAQFATAKSTRAAIEERLREIVAPKVANLRDGVKEFLGRLSGQEQFAYFHKLESCATEEDLQSLLDDVEKLTTIRELKNGSES